MNTCQSTKIVIVCSQALGWFALSPRNFGPLKLRRDCTYYAHRHAILQIENVFECTVVPVRPDVVTCRGINELSGDANTVAGLADAALQHVTDAEFAADPLDVDSFA